MKKHVEVYEFRDIMMSQASFSYEGAEALFDYLEDLEHDIGEEIEFDPIELRGEFCEYDSIEEAMDDILADSDNMTEEEFEDDYVIAHLDDGGVILHNI